MAGSAEYNAAQLNLSRGTAPPNSNLICMHKAITPQGGGVTSVPYRSFVDSFVGVSIRLFKVVKVES